MRVFPRNYTRTILLCVLFLTCADGPPAQQAVKPGEIKIEYDAQSNTTKVTLNPVMLAGRKQEQLHMGAFYLYSGRTVAKPEVVTLAFVSLSAAPQGKYETARKLTLITDGQRFPLGEAARTTQAQDQILLEMLTASVPYDTWLRVMNARDVAIKLGISEVKLTPEVLTLLRGLVDPSLRPATASAAGATTPALPPPPTAETLIDSATDLVKFPSAAVEFIAGPQLKAGSSTFFDRNEIERGHVHGAKFPALPPGGASLTGTVTVTQGSKEIVGNGTRFLTEMKPFVSNYCYVEDQNGVRRTYLLASVTDDTHLTLTAPYAQASGANRRVSGATADSVDAYSNANYYDLALCEYIAYYRTGDVRFRDYARKIADSWWKYPAIAEGTNRDFDNSLAPRGVSLSGLMLRALDGRPEMWPWITDYVRYEFDTWVGKRIAYPGLYYGVRDGGYMLLYAATLARVHPDATVRKEFYNKSLNTAVNYYARLQYPDGSFRWEDGEGGRYWQGTGTQPFQVGLMLEGMIAVHRNTNNETVKLAILRGVKSLYQPECYNPKGWRALYYLCNSTTPSYGAVADPFPPPDPVTVREARQLNATVVHAFGYAYFISGDAKYRTMGDDIFDATYSRRDGVYGLADFREKEYNESYRTGGKYLAWRLGEAVSSTRLSPARR